jgi:hypothetical protein
MPPRSRPEYCHCGHYLAGHSERTGRCLFVGNDGLECQCQAPSKVSVRLNRQPHGMNYIDWPTLEEVCQSGDHSNG